jgi:hypothetical protein
MGRSFFLACTFCMALAGIGFALILFGEERFLLVGCLVLVTAATSLLIFIFGLCAYHGELTALLFHLCFHLIVAGAVGGLLPVFLAKTEFFQVITGIALGGLSGAMLGLLQAYRKMPRSKSAKGRTNMFEFQRNAGTCQLTIEYLGERGRNTAWDLGGR